MAGGSKGTFHLHTEMPTLLRSRSAITILLDYYYTKSSVLHWRTANSAWFDHTTSCSVTSALIKYVRLVHNLWAHTLGALKSNIMLHSPTVLEGPSRTLLIVIQDLALLDENHTGDWLPGIAGEISDTLKKDGCGVLKLCLRRIVRTMLNGYGSGLLRDRARKPDPVGDVPRITVIIASHNEERLLVVGESDKHWQARRDSALPAASSALGVLCLIYGIISRHANA
ncbi:hypothetical protein BKA67DRAFT_537981 [Truncatella angustata]|uniref:Uncharacterized protein n=1 Tax=Truncatella angustata TaxID=152316 RepID=A0A9P8UHB4_9PEZI|nr:uncharacterized protein BKA67DRAFT_537981 [Truncatella angustata]KAH6652148.1 hypothetical protein BKA67DRAFT_537981 [Truncatella angustata]